MRSQASLSDEAGSDNRQICWLNFRNPDLDPDLSIDQEKGMNWLGCASVAAGATLILRCRSYNFQFFLQM